MIICGILFSEGWSLEFWSGVYVYSGSWGTCLRVFFRIWYVRNKKTRLLYARSFLVMVVLLYTLLM